MRDINGSQLTSVVAFSETLRMLPKYVYDIAIRDEPILLNMDMITRKFV